MELYFSKLTVEKLPPHFMSASTNVYEGSSVDRFQLLTVYVSKAVLYAS